MLIKGSHVEFSGEYIVEYGARSEWAIDTRKRIGIVIQIDNDNSFHILSENKIFILKNSYVFDLKVLTGGE